MIDELRHLEELKCAAEARQAELAVAFEASQRGRQAERRVPAARQGRGVAEQIALARRVSPHRGKRLLSLARTLHHELPHTRAAFIAGKIAERKADTMVRETECLSAEHRIEVDRRIAADPLRIEAMGDRELASRVQEIAYELDARSWVKRRARAEADRRVTCRPAPDVMTHLSALLPVKLGVAVYATLCREADRLLAAGDQRNRGQIMADTLVERVLDPVAATGDATIAVTVNVVVPDTVLLGDDGPAYVDGYGPVPGDLARELAVGTDHVVAFRRLYSRPDTGQLVAMESRSTAFPKALATFIRLRDQVCRTPWCDAPIRHTDHVLSRDEGGQTSGANGQGLCEGCNYAKEADGWQARPRPGPRHTVETTTPTGHHYRSRAPATGVSNPWERSRSGPGTFDQARAS